MVDVSVVVATRHRPQQLSACLDALARVETQRPWQLVVVDNGPSPDTAEVLARHRSRFARLDCVDEPRRGLGRAQLTGVRVAVGRLVAFTDDDCYVSPDYIDELVAAFHREGRVGFVGGRILLHDPQDLPVTICIGTERHVVAPRSYLAAGEFQGANLAFRREVLELVGGPDPALGPGTPYNCVDIDLVTAASWAGYAGAYDPGPTVSHHHGRREADRVALFQDYAAGRGVNYARRILDRRSRRLYLRDWLRRAWTAKRHPQDWGTLWIELRSAARYVARGGRARCDADLDVGRVATGDRSW